MNDVPVWESDTKFFYFKDLKCSLLTRLIGILKELVTIQHILNSLQ